MLPSVDADPVAPMGGAVGGSAGGSTGGARSGTNLNAPAWSPPNATTTEGGVPRVGGTPSFTPNMKATAWSPSAGAEFPSDDVLAVQSSASHTTGINGGANSNSDYYARSVGGRGGFSRGGGAGRGAGAGVGGAGYPVGRGGAVSGWREKGQANYIRSGVSYYNTQTQQSTAAPPTPGMKLGQQQRTPVGGGALPGGHHTAHTAEYSSAGDTPTKAGGGGSGENLPLGVGGGEGAPASGGRGLGSTFFAGQLVHSNIPEPLPEPAEYRPYVAPPPPTTPPPPRPAAVESVVVNSVESVLMDDEEGGGGGEAPIGLPTVDSSEPTRPGQPLLAVDGDAPDQQQHQQPSTNDDDDEGITARDIAATLADATGSSPATTGTPTSAAAAKGLDPTVKEFAPFSVTSSNDTPTTTLPGNHNNNHDESNMVGGGGAGGTRSVAPPVSISDTYNKTVVPLNVGVGHEYGVPPPKMLTDEEFEETAATEEGGLGGGQKPFPLLKPYGGPRGPSPAPNGFVLGETLIFSAPPDPFNEPFTVRICDLPMKVINELKNRYIARRMRVDDPGVRVAADPLLPNTYSLDRNKGVMKLPLHQMCVSTAQGARVFIGQCPAQAQTMGMNAVPGPHGRPAFRTDHDLTCKVFLCVLYWIEFEMPLNYGHQHYTTMGDLLFQGLCTCRPWVQEYDRHWMISTFNHRIAISKTAERELQIWPKKPDFLTIKERFLLLTFEIQHGRMERENARRKANVEYQPLRYGAHGNGEGGEYEEGQEEAGQGENDQQSSQGAPRPAFTGHAASAPAAFGERPAAAPPSAVGGSVALGTSTSTSSAANLAAAPKVNHELSMKKAKENAMSKIQLATQRLMLSVGLTIPGFSAVVADLKAHYVAKASTSAHWSPAEANSTRTLIDKYGGVMEIVLDELLPPDNVSTNYPGQATQDTLLATLKYRTGYVLAPLLDFSALEHGSLHTNNYSPQCVLQHLRQEDPSSTAADIHGNSSAAFVLQRLEIPEAAAARQQAQEEAKKIQQQKSQPVLLQAVGEEDDGVVIGGGTLPARPAGGPKPRKRGNYHLLLKGPRVPLNRTSTLENPLESRRLLFHIGWQLVKEYHHFGKCHGSVSLESVVMLYPPGACDANRAAAGLDPELCTYRLTPPIQNNPIGTPVSNKPGGGAAGGQPLGPGAASWSGTKATPAQIQQDVQDYCVLVLQVLYPDQLLLGSQSSSSAAKSNTTRKSKENFFGPSTSCGAIEEEAASHVSFFERLSVLSGDLEGIVRQVQDFKRREEQELREATQGAHGPPPSLSMLYEGYSQQAAMATLALHQFCESLDVNTAIQQVNAVSASATMRPGVRNTLPPHPANVASYQIKQQHQIQAASGGGSVAILLDHFLEMFIRVQWTSTVQKGGPQRKQLKVSLPKDLWAAADQSAKDAAEKAKQEKSNLWDSAKVIPVLAAPRDEAATKVAADTAAVQGGGGTKSVQDYSVTVVGPFSPKMRVSGATQQQQDHKVGAIPSDIVVRTLSGFSVEEHKSEVAFQQFLSAARSSAAAAGGAPPGESTLEQVLVVGKTLQLIIGTVGAGAADVTGTGPADAGIRTVSCVEFLKSQVPPVQGQHPLPEAVSTLSRQLLTLLNDQYMYQQQASPSSSSAVSAETLLKLRVPQLCVNPEAAAEAPTAATGGRPQCLIAAYPPTLDATESAEGLQAGETVAVLQQAGNSAPKHQSTKPAAVSEGGVTEITAADVVKKGTPAFLGDLLLFLGRTVGGWIMALLPSKVEDEGEEGEDEKKKKILNPHTMAPIEMLKELKKRLHIENDEDGDAPLHCPLSFEFVELVFRYAVVVLASDVGSLGDNQYCLETLVAHEFLSPPLGGAAAVSVTPPSLSAVLGKNADLLHLYTAGVGDENDSSSSISQGPRDLLSYFHPSHPARALVVQFLTRRLIFQNESSSGSGSLKDVIDRLCLEAEELERHTQQTTRRNAGGDDTDAHSDADDEEEEEEIVLAKPHRGGGTKRTEMELRHDLTQVVIHILTCVWRWSTGEAHSAGPMPSYCSSSPTSSSLSNVGSSYRDDDGGEEDWALYFPVHEVSTWSPLLAAFVSHCLDALASLANPCITLKETLSEVKVVQGGAAAAPPLHQTTTGAEAVHIAEENKKNMKKQEGRSSFSFFGLLGHEFLNQPPAVTEFISNIDFASPPISGVPHAVQKQATAVSGHSLTVEEIYFLLAAYCSTKTSVAENATGEDLSALPSLVLQNMLVAYQNHSAQMVKLAEQQHRLQPFLPTPHVSLPPLISQFAKLASLEVIKSITPGNNTAAADQNTPQISSWMQSRYGTSLELFFKGATEDPSGSPFLDALHRGPWDAQTGAAPSTSTNAFIAEVTKCLEPPQPVPAPAPVVAPAPTATGQQHHMFEHQHQQHHHYQQQQQQQPAAVKSTPIVAPAPRSHQQQHHQTAPVAPGHHQHQQHDPHVVMTRSAQLSAATAELQHQFQHEQQHPPLMMQFAPPISDRQRITGLLAATNQTQPQQQQQLAQSHAHVQQHAPLLPPAGVPAQSSPPAPWDFDTQE